MPDDLEFEAPSCRVCGAALRYTLDRRGSGLWEGDLTEMREDSSRAASSKPGP